MDCLIFPARATGEGLKKFDNLICVYKDLTRLLQFHFYNYDKFPAVREPELREIVPSDVSSLIANEKACMAFWVEKVEDFGDISEEDKRKITQHYYVRKVSLDHFYVASQHVEYAKKRIFVLINYTTVPLGKTGFELPLDDDLQREAKYEIFRATFDSFWTQVVDKFIAMKATDADICFVHLLLLWSPRNDTSVSSDTRILLQQRREWAIQLIREYYRGTNVGEPEARIIELTRIAEDIDAISTQHIEDVQLASLFDIKDFNCPRALLSDNGPQQNCANVVLKSYASLFNTNF